MMKNAIYMQTSVTDTICNSFIITTDDGKIIVIDGGFATETDHFLARLKEIAESDCPQIDAWFLTHPHDDHTDCFYTVIEEHFQEISLERVYLNFPSREFFVGNDNSAADTMERFYRNLPKIADRLRFVSGCDTLDIGSAHIRMLYSADFEIRGCNNASLVFRMELGGKSILFTGDCGPEAGKKVLRLWKDTGLLNCDICQMAHHGQDGCDQDFYQAVSPEVCLWCTPSWLWTNNNGTGPFKTLIVRKWMEDLGVKEHYVIKDGDCTVLLGE